MIAMFLRGVVSPEIVWNYTQRGLAHTQCLLTWVNCIGKWQQLYTKYVNSIGKQVQC